jgi:hypothetical protein
MKKRLNFKCLDYRYMSHQKNIINTSKILKSCRTRIKDFAISAIVVIAVWIIDTWWCICSVHTWDMENCKGYLVRIQEFEIWVVLRYRLWQNKKYINNWKKQIEIVCVCVERSPPPPYFVGGVRKRWRMEISITINSTAILINLHYLISYHAMCFHT